jgi:hypothetical protein
MHGIDSEKLYRVCEHASWETFQNKFDIVSRSRSFAIWCHILWYMGLVKRCPFTTKLCSITSQKIIILILNVVRTTNLISNAVLLRVKLQIREVFDALSNICLKTHRMWRMPGRFHPKSSFTDRPQYVCQLVHHLGVIIMKPSVSLTTGWMYILWRGA